ncbi:hypothetical protein MMC08_005403 [Hypocenomyce scalaris]|nr:hypothetical protein [Hypocenomyce scalaris]
MSISKKRSHSDMHDVEEVEPEGYPFPVYEETNAYNMRVLRLENGQTERALDQTFLRAALELGIPVPQDSKITLELATSNISALDFSSPPSEPEIDREASALPSRFSQSTHAPSCSSSVDQHPVTTTSSLTTAPSATPSISSSESKRRSYTKFKQGIRRISTFRKRRTLSASVSSISSISSKTAPDSSPALLKTSREKRFATPDLTPASNPPAMSPPVSSPPIPSPLSIPQKSLALCGEEQLLVHPPIPAHPIHEDEETLAAQQRSMSNDHIQELRATQLEEQIRFLHFEAEQHRLIRSKQAEVRRALLDHYKQREQAMRDRHTEVLSTVEHRQLTAEVDLRRTLELELQACNTKLKHMKAYCDGKSPPVDDMPQRVVTDKDYRNLAQQFHLRNGMDNLHEARINVLRERQAKRLERIVVKQEAEVEALTDMLEREVRGLVDNKFTGELADLQRDLMERKYRLVRRWMLAEAIERHKLENEAGEVFGSLPKINWPEKTTLTTKPEMTPASSDPMVEQDVATYNMI